MTGSISMNACFVSLAEFKKAKLASLGLPLLTALLDSNTDFDGGNFDEFGKSNAINCQYFIKGLWLYIRINLLTNDCFDRLYK